MESPSSLSLNYLRAVQQLEKKTEELERVFDEARRLEREKAALAEKNAALLNEVAQLEAQNKEWRAEFTVLEQQVRQQQQHLQAQIEREAARLQNDKNKEKEGINTAKAKDRDSESLHILQQQQKQQQERLREGLEAAKTENANLTAKCRTLTREAAELRRELKTAKAQAAHYRSTHARAAADGAAIDEIESKALRGVKSELTAFAEENERLMNELQAERRARGVAEEGVNNLQMLLQRQRDASERQQLIAKQELQALNIQNDSLLEDLKRMMTREAEYNNNNNNNNTIPHHRSYFSVDRGTMTTEVFYTPARSPPMMTTATKTTIEGGRGTTIPYHKRQKLSAPLEISPDESELRLQELQEKLHILEDMTVTQARVIQEKEVNERLLEERAELLAEERKHLRALLDNSVTQERWGEHLDSSNIVRAVADTELGSILEAVVDVLRRLVNSTTQLRSRIFRQSMGTIESTVLPVVPCREYSSPHLNAIFSHIGGIRHIADLIDQISAEKFTQEEEKEAKLQKEQHQVQQQKQKQKQNKHISITSTINQEPNLLTTTVNLQSHDTSRNSAPDSSTHSPSKTTTVRNISAWLAARQNNLKEQLQQSNSSKKDESTSTYFSTYKYQSGETLMDAARELRSQSYRTIKQNSKH